MCPSVIIVETPARVVQSFRAFFVSPISVRGPVTPSCFCRIGLANGAVVDSIFSTSVSLTRFTVSVKKTAVEIGSAESTIEHLLSRWSPAHRLSVQRENDIAFSIDIPKFSDTSGSRIHRFTDAYSVFRPSVAILLKMPVSGRIVLPSDNAAPF